ncbi:MAG TPA: hypothetical protein GX702_03190 [Chloroflexi bacterium]|jgi:hypothetical protein|nr:hypothetical protein [Chloroflexota bacterium]
MVRVTLFRAFFRLSALCAVFLLQACALAAEPAPDAGADPTELLGGVLATFDVADERFRIWVTNPETIEQILDVYYGEVSGTFPSGRIVRGPGLAGHNAPWNWHLDPEDVAMVANAPESCDGLPSYVEANRTLFLDQIGRYCPRSAILVGVQDLR